MQTWWRRRRVAVKGNGRVVLCLHSLNSAEELYRGLFNEFNWLKGNSNHLEYAAVE